MSRCELRRQLGMLSKSDDTPRKKHLLKVCTNLKNKVKRLSREKQCLRKEFKRSFSNAHVLKLIEPQVTREAYELLRTQLDEGEKSPQGRRYRLDLKILSVGLWKSGPRTYSFLSSVFVLPAKRTLQTFLEQFQFQPGFNMNLVVMLLERFRNLGHEDRFVSLLWDGTSMKHHLSFDSRHDLIVGYEDLGEGHRTRKVATEFLVFMIVSINPDKKRWKQPIGYINCSKSIDAKFLASQILFYLKLLICIGLRPVATVCDQHPTNVKAVKMLQESDSNPVVKMSEGICVALTFDTPHQLKCLRNLLLKNNLHTKNGIVKFSYFINLYKCDLKNFPRHCWKLTEMHISPLGKQKMKVCPAAHLFSRSVALYLRHLINGKFDGFPLEALETVAFIILIDHWFDSVNGRKKKACTGNLLF